MTQQQSHKEAFEQVRKDALGMVSIFISLAEKTGKFKGDFSEQDLMVLEEAIEELYPVGHEAMPTTYIPFGLYLGETLVKNIPEAKWDVESAESIFDSKIVFENDQTSFVIMPFRRIMNFWKDRSDGLAVLYRTANMMSLNLMPNTESGKWVQFANGDQFRFTSADELPEDQKEELLKKFKTK